MKIREVIIEDAKEISSFLQELTALGKRTLPDDEDFVRTIYIDNVDNIQCVVAEDNKGSILGLQVLKLAALGNIYGVEKGWGIIGTHVSPSATRKGIGKALFAVIKKAAMVANITNIDASIAATNIEGLGYYEAIGFRTYRKTKDKICKNYKVPE